MTILVSIPHPEDAALATALRALLATRTCPKTLRAPALAWLAKHP